MISPVLSIIGVVLALAATIVAWILIVPEKKRAGLNKFFQYIHDLFNFKSLWLEKILKFLYIFETLSCIISGFLLLFSFSSYETYSYSGKFRSTTHTTWNGWIGLLLIVFGPIIVRILFEFVMMLILQVKNTMEINDKLNAQPGSRFEERLIEAKQREEEIAARRAQQKAAYAQQQQYQQAQQFQQAQPFQQPQQQYQQAQPFPQEQQYQPQQYSAQTQQADDTTDNQG